MSKRKANENRRTPPRRLWTVAYDLPNGGCGYYGMMFSTRAKAFAEFRTAQFVEMFKATNPRAVCWVRSPASA